MRCERSSTRSLFSFRRCCLLPQSCRRCSFAAGASITSFGPRCTIMARVPYALVTCFSTGAPWCEQLPGTDFDEFMTRSFGGTVPYGYPSQDQDLEFSCALPSRSGANSFVKGSSACDNIAGPESSRYLLAIRGLWMPPNSPDVVPRPSKWEPKSKFWLAVRARAGVEIPWDIASD